LISLLRALWLCSGLFVATYVPTFVIVGALKKPLEAAVPLIIGMSLLFSLALMNALRMWSRYALRDFGFRGCASRYLLWAVGGGIPIAIALTWLDHRFGSAGPLAGLVLPYWKALLLFGICAPIQEEIIFRGLIQTVVARAFAGNVMLGGIRSSYAVLIVAVLFGLIHLEVAIFTAVAAFILGVLAGELRDKSRSLIPSFILHALFNMASFLWIGSR